MQLWTPIADAWQAGRNGCYANQDAWLRRLTATSDPHRPACDLGQARPRSWPHVLRRSEGHQATLQEASNTLAASKVGCASTAKVSRIDGTEAACESIGRTDSGYCHERTSLWAGRVRRGGRVEPWDKSAYWAAPLDRCRTGYAWLDPVAAQPSRAHDEMLDSYDRRSFWHAVSGSDR